MRSPRHRYNLVAQQLNLPYQRDGLAIMGTLDTTSKELKKVLSRQGANKAFSRAIEIFRSDSARTLYEAILFSTAARDMAGAIAATCRILGENPEHLQIYCACFFDLAVFTGAAERTIYLEKLAGFDEQTAVMLRNALTLSEEDLLFLHDKYSAKKVDAKTALDTGLQFWHAVMRVFQNVKLEDLLNEKKSTEEKEHLDWMFSKATTATNMVHKLSKAMLEHDLDKSSENFLEDMKLTLLAMPPESLIQDKADPENPEEKLY
jgi:hypothetical protein